MGVDSASLTRDLVTAMTALNEERAEDLRRLDGLMGAMGQSFTTSVFGFFQINALKDTIGTFLDLAVDARLAPDAFRLVFGEIAGKQRGALTRRYKLLDTAGFLGTIDGFIQTSDDRQGWRQVLVHFFEYLSFLNRRLRDRLPFHELSVAFEGAKRVNAEYERSPAGA